MTEQTRNLPIAGMHCSGCEAKIQTAVSELKGVIRVEASHAAQRVRVVFEDQLLSVSQILACIEAQGYSYAELSELPPQSSFGWRKLMVLSGLLLLVGGVAMFGKSQMPGLMGQFNASVGYAAIFSVGLITGLHCIGMCGGFVVAYSTGVRGFWPQLRAHVLYASGKNLSYALIGAAMGALGSLVSVTPVMRGSVSLLSGMFLIFFGLNMLGWLPLIRLTGRAQSKITHTVYQDLKPRRNPFAIGFFSGFLIGCGPLQAMYIAALESADALTGGLLLLCFGSGTLVPLLLFAIFAGALSPQTQALLFKVSGLLVAVMGGMMLMRGWGMLGANGVMSMH